MLDFGTPRTAHPRPADSRARHHLINALAGELAQFAQLIRLMPYARLN